MQARWSRVTGYVSRRAFEIGARRFGLFINSHIQNLPGVALRTIYYQDGVAFLEIRCGSLKKDRFPDEAGKALRLGQAGFDRVPLDMPFNLFYSLECLRQLTRARDALHFYADIDRDRR